MNELIVLNDGSCEDCGGGCCGGGGCC